MKVFLSLLGIFLCSTLLAQIEPAFSSKGYSNGIIMSYTEQDNDGRIFYEEGYNKQGDVSSVKVYCYDDKGWMRYKFATAFTVGDAREKDLLRALVYTNLSDSTQGFQKAAFRITLPDSLTKEEYLKKLYQNNEMESLMNPESFEELSETCSFMINENGLELSNEFYSGTIDLYGKAKYEYSYDSRGRISEERFGRIGSVSQITSFEYDEFDRVSKQTIQITYLEKPQVLEFSYDENGNKVEVMESPFSYSVRDEGNERILGERYIRKEIDFRKEVYTFVWIPYLNGYKWTRKEEYYEEELIAYSKYEYNDRGDPVQFERGDGDSEKYSSEWEYQYFDE